MDKKPKPSDSAIILGRVAMLGEDYIPDEVWERFIKLPEDKMTFLTVADPDQWPHHMQGLRTWIEENVPPQYWAEME